MRNAFMPALVLAAAGFGATGAMAAETPAGTWLTADGSSKIRISRCGEALCAGVVWIRDDVRDENNPDPALRKRRLTEVQLSHELHADRKGGWAGPFYNPENGKTYDVTLRLPAPRSLEVGGCVLGGLLCGSETWTKVEETAALGTR